MLVCSLHPYGYSHASIVKESNLDEVELGLVDDVLSGAEAQVVDSSQVANNVQSDVASALQAPLELLEAGGVIAQLVGVVNSPDVAELLAEASHANAGLPGAAEHSADGVEAIFNAIDKFFNQTVRLTSYNIDAVTDGIDAQARVLVTVENVDTDTIFNASGLDFDVLKASAIAYINANTLVQKENAGEMARKVSYRDLP